MRVYRPLRRGLRPIRTPVDTTERNTGVGNPLEGSLSANIFSLVVVESKTDLDSTTMLDNCTIAHRGQLDPQRFLI
jgi:hypothetical protein